MKIAPDRMKKLVSAIFAAAGCRPPEDERVGHYLVEANLVGHDSHGVIRVPIYIDWLRQGKVRANQKLQIVFENDVIAVVDGQYGFGQTMGEQAMELGIRKCRKTGVAVVALRNPGHLGRVGDWPLMATRANLISIHFVNTSGMGILVAPTGGIDRRLSANPVAVGIPIKNGSPIIWDVSTSTVAEGKLKVAFNKGVPVPENCIIDSQGRPTTDPKVFYGNPPGAILPFGGHKGYGLGIIADILAGALTGNSCSDPAKADRLTNGMLTILLDPAVFQTEDYFQSEVERFVTYVRGSRKVSPDIDILMPGEPEERTRVKRLQDGIELDDKTWSQITATCQTVGLSQQVVEETLK